MFDVVSAGDIMIDFSQCGYGPNGNPAYEMNPGGAPAHMLVACSLLGAKTAFIGKVGDDLFGRHVAGALKRYGISDEGVVYTTIDHTMISFVSFDEDGDRSFYFVGKGVDHLLTADEVNRSVLDRANIIYSTYGLAKSLTVLRRCVFCRITPSSTASYLQLTQTIGQRAIYITRRL